MSLECWIRDKSCDSINEKMVNKEMIDMNRFSRMFDLCLAEGHYLDGSPFENLEMKRISTIIKDEWANEDIGLHPLSLIPVIITLISFLMAFIGHR